MRVVYGAGAVAAVSVMTIGLVKPAWDPASADLAAVDPGMAGPRAQATPPRVGSTGSAGSPGVEVQHVIKYIHLKPGQQAPPGATVITPDAPQPRVVTVHVKPSNNTQHNQPPAAGPVQAPPQPPRIRTHQSGRPR